MYEIRACVTESSSRANETKAAIHFLIAEVLCKRKIGAAGRKGLIEMLNLARTRYETHYLHARSRGGRERRERNGQKKSDGGREGDTAYPATRQKCGTEHAGPSLFFFLFFHCK